MRKAFSTFILFCSVVLLFGSCLSDDTQDITYPDDTAITSFSIGTLNQYIDSVGSAGQDSVYKKTIDCSKVKFYIDQVNRLIYNPDSLPFGIDASKVLATVNAKNAGTVVIKLKAQDGTDSLAFYSSTDSLDFTEPLEVRSYNSSATAYRSYMVHVNVHKQVANQFNWSQVEANDTQLGALTAMKAVSMGDHVYVFGVNGGNTLVYGTPSTDGKTWSQSPQTFDADAYKSACSDGTSLYILDGGAILGSTDGNSWVQIATTSATQLLGVSGDNLYALMSDNTLAVSADGGLSWTTEALGDDATMLPTTNISFCGEPLPTNENTNQLWIVGNRGASDYPDDANAMVWGKVEENGKGSETQPWTFYDISSDNNFPAPRLTNLQVDTYNGGMIAFGGAGIGANTTPVFNAFYMSYDGGITWQEDTRVTVPAGFNSSAASFAMTVDTNNFVWVVCGESGQVWKGRLSQLGWDDNQTSFTK